MTNFNYLLVRSSWSVRKRNFSHEIKRSRSLTLDFVKAKAWRSKLFLKSTPFFKKVYKIWLVIQFFTNHELNNFLYINFLMKKRQQKNPWEKTWMITAWHYWIIYLKTGFKCYFDQIEIKSLFYSKSYREYPSQSYHLKITFKFNTNRFCFNSCLYIA